MCSSIKKISISYTFEGILNYSEDGVSGTGSVTIFDMKRKLKRKLEILDDKEGIRGDEGNVP